ncbi:hypothetical protein E2N92_08235 [Methanofollis formosanus]|uniref:Methyltransferase n=1 Tax=Methanofollis formosanus TaxID=299308 RepID=A0A8G1A2Y4_9EURY|nr:hypothetical protein [Methanofollis formosanus]QYZ79419.1 hypothetical protein E2N92_08235 [Methanofollis formosanus]
MQCPVCGAACLQDAGSVLATLPDVFTPCERCAAVPLDKRCPLPADYEPATPCRCGRRFIDDVFAACYLIFADEGVINGTEALGAIATPLVNPGFAMSAPPFLSAQSLVLLSPHPDRTTADRIVHEVPEVQGVVQSSAAVPGVGADGTLVSHTLLAGCDVQANIFPTSFGDFVVYKELSRLHLEFPRPVNPKIRAVERAIRRENPTVFVDACCGAGTLGLAAALTGTPEVVFNDAYGPAAFWTAVNLMANREALLIDEVVLHTGRADLPAVGSEPVLVAEGLGEQHIAVYQGDFARLPAVLPAAPRSLTALDIFGKEEREAQTATLDRWKRAGGGKAFIP